MPVYSRLVTASLSLGLLVLGSAYAGAYRWVDEDGVTHYTQTPPINEESTLLDDPKPPTRSSEEAWKELNEQRAKQEKNKTAQERKAMEKQEKQRIAENEIIREQNCEAARRNLANLQSGRTNRLVKTPSGEYKRLTDEDHQQSLEQARKNIEEFCD
jgi:nitrate/TMAO reductase-like tetraheme cytochrome c subunit